MDDHVQNAVRTIWLRMLAGHLAMICATTVAQRWVDVAIVDSIKLQIVTDEHIYEEWDLE
jgi:hypothetical protein